MQETETRFVFDADLDTTTRGLSGNMRLGFVRAAACLIVVGFARMPWLDANETQEERKSKVLLSFTHISVFEHWWFQATTIYTNIAIIPKKMGVEHLHEDWEFSVFRCLKFRILATLDVVPKERCEGNGEDVEKWAWKGAAGLIPKNNNFYLMASADWWWTSFDAFSQLNEKF